jgi:hypothetical protein
MAMVGSPTLIERVNHRSFANGFEGVLTSARFHELQESYTTSVFVACNGVRNCMDLKSSAFHCSLSEHQQSIPLASSGCAGGPEGVTRQLPH